MTHQLDSIKSKTYKPDGSGISLGSSVKVFGKWFKKPSVWDFRGIFNHELVTPWDLLIPGMDWMDAMIHRHIRIAGIKQILLLVTPCFRTT
jgi:hypothetical protein